MRSLDRILVILSVVALLLSILALAPPHRQRQWRGLVAKLMLWLWVKTARISHILHDEFWSEGNGDVY